MTAIVFENISKQYRLGLVSTGTLSHDLNRFWQTKVLRREDPYLKVGEVNDRAHKGASEYVWALKDINLQKPLSLGHGQTSLAATLAHRGFSRWNRATSWESSGVTAPARARSSSC